ncbi:MAG: DNA polymerase III subunit psi [Plesiomonas sp.]|uniref:DNA polymerase III subunit psi n=1 Tax=Plesiomonas sp. TaxID=2486279 RepID=UPI003EE74089
MSERRDWILQQMGITQWQLRQPAALQGDAAVRVDAQIQLIVVAAELPTGRLFEDVLRTLQVTSEHVCHVRPAQYDFLHVEHACWLWLMGSEGVPLSGCRQLYSAALSTLVDSDVAKKQLWQQIVGYERQSVSA